MHSRKQDKRKYEPCKDDKIGHQPLLLAGDIVGFPYLTIPTRSPYSVFLFGTLSYSASLLGFPIWDTYSVTLFGALGSTALPSGEEVL